MDDLREIIAGNLVSLRSAAGMTQATLAQKLNYSDKAVSKWERGESIPDVIVLKQIADLFSVSVDYLLEGEHSGPAPDGSAMRVARRRHILIACLSVGLVWLVATYLFVQFSILNLSGGLPLWMTFIYAVPVSSILLLVFNSIWGRRRTNALIVSALCWSALVSLFLTCLFLLPETGGLWMIFLLGVPAEVLILLWFGFPFRRRPPVKDPPPSSSSES